MEPVLWTVDGTALESEAWGVDDWGGSLESPPALRGGGTTIPYRPGQVWAPQVAETRTLTFNMWLTDQDPDTGEHLGVEQLLANWATLRALFWGHPGRQVEIVRESGLSESAQEVTGRGSFAGGLEPANFALSGARFSASLLLSDPWLYAAEVELGEYPVGTHAITGDILGDVASPRYTLTFTGPLSVPGVTVRRGSEVLSSLTLRVGLTAGQSWTVTLPDGAYSGLAGVTPADVAATRQAWVALDPSATTLVVSGTGAGSVTIDYEPAFL